MDTTVGGIDQQQAQALFGLGIGFGAGQYGIEPGVGGVQDIALFSIKDKTITVCNRLRCDNRPS